LHVEWSSELIITVVRLRMGCRPCSPTYCRLSSCPRGGDRLVEDVDAQAECCLLFRFSATASRMRFFSAPSSSLSFSLMSMARLTFPSRLELNRPEGSSNAAPLKNVSLTTFL